jgi:hypothetical protein
LEERNMFEAKFAEAIAERVQMEELKGAKVEAGKKECYFDIKHPIVVKVKTEGFKIIVPVIDWMKVYNSYQNGNHEIIETYVDNTVWGFGILTEENEVNWRVFEPEGGIKKIKKIKEYLSHGSQNTEYRNLKRALESIFSEIFADVSIIRGKGKMPFITIKAKENKEAILIIPNCIVYAIQDGLQLIRSWEEIISKDMIFAINGEYKRFEEIKEEVVN